MLSEPKIIFHHIPKCGGTSFVTSLVLTYYPFRLLRHGRKGFAGVLNVQEASEAAKKENISQYQYRKKLLANLALKEKTNFISGHYPFNHDFFDAHGHDWNSITVLRDPVERWYSEYYWNRYKDHDYKKTDLSMESYLDTEEGKINTRSYINYFSRSQNYDHLPTSEDIHKAIETLEKIHIVGFLDNIPKYKADMKQTFGRAPIMVRRNKSPAKDKQASKPDVHSVFHKKLLRKLEGDIEVYHKIKEKRG